ncbi:Protein CBG23494 [Caenorhabditis briggsae]|uniref:Protein CBG23494 n=1 Tax=Caenorhabditis briggsae TaxID=6238 RepID=A8Y3S4_CAEBR|nr:Protein CBG23494 [Caenorhabditis briggsae]CAP39543.2 Protein CBG23494 [Caenorhabditis briggsae]
MKNEEENGQIPLEKLSEKNCARYRMPYICLSHFEEGKRSKNKIPRNIPPREVSQEELDHWLWGEEEGRISDDSSEPTEVDSVSEESDFQRPDHEGADPMEIDDVDEVEISEKPQQYNLILCEKEKLVKLLQKCWKCETQKTEMGIVYHGLNMNISVFCVSCQRRWYWSNTKKCEREQSGSNSKLSRIHILLTSAIITTGNGFQVEISLQDSYKKVYMQNVKQLFDVLKSPFFFARTFNRLKEKYVYEAVNIQYKKQANVVKELLCETTDNNGTLNVMGDGSFDTPGHSALYCRYVIMEAVTKLVVEYEIFRHKSGEKKVNIETEACEKAFENLMVTYDSAIESLTTDRSQSVASMMANNFPDVTHYFDSWHYIRSLALEILKQFLPLKPWIRRFINHVYWSIQSSGGHDEMAKEKLLSFFMHVADIHKDFQDSGWYDFKIVNSCEHNESDDVNRKRPDFLDTKNPLHVKALNALLAVIEKGDRCEAIGRVSPYFATSAVESFNARAGKIVFSSQKGFNSRTQLAVLDWNSKQLDELNGKRVVIAEKRFFNKTTKQWSVRKEKTPADYSFRNEIADITVELYIKATHADELEDEDEGSDCDEHELDEELSKDVFDVNIKFQLTVCVLSKLQVDDIWAHLGMADSDEEESVFDEEEKENEEEKEDSDNSMKDGEGRKMDDDEEEERNEKEEDEIEETRLKKKKKVPKK